MKVHEITEYQNFVSFIVESSDAGCVHVQYRRDQVWQDEQGIWHIAEGEQKPFHISRLSRPSYEKQQKLSLHLVQAMGTAAKSLMSDTSP